MRRALIIFYSQAGQTEKAMNRLEAGLKRHIPCDRVRIEPLEPYPFPWRLRSFFRIFPRAVAGVVPEIRPLDIRWDDYDLVIFAYQVWFLSPSLPAQAFLKSPSASGLKGRTVISLVTCRNLWHSAYECVRREMLDLRADFRGQITLCERSPIWASFVTTPRWMLTGKKNPFAFFPAAGIEDSEFEYLVDAGEKIGANWVSSRSVQPTFLKSNLNRPSLVLMDRIGRNFFEIWASVILSLSRHDGWWRDTLIFLFRLNLIILIICVVPVTSFFEIFLNSSATEREQP